MRMQLMRGARDGLLVVLALATLPMAGVACGAEGEGANVGADARTTDAAPTVDAQAEGAAPSVPTASSLRLRAGALGGGGDCDGPAAAARFSGPGGVVTDESGNVFVADYDNRKIRKISSAGVVTTVAGSGEYGTADGAALSARFDGPTGIALDASGNLFVTESIAHTIRKISAGGVVTTIAGAPHMSGSADGVGASARFNRPSGIGVDASGNLFVADTNNDTIRKISPAGAVTTLAGSAGIIGSTNGAGSSARFNHPRGVAVDVAGNVFVADSSNYTIRKITPAGVVTILAGTAGASGSADGAGGIATFFAPEGVALDSTGNVFVADSFNGVVRKVSSAGVVTTLGGAGTRNLRFPTGVSVDVAGNVFVADEFAQMIRKVSPTGSVSTVAGAQEQSGSADGTGAVARFHGPSRVAADDAGNVFVADSENNKIRKITAAGVVTTLAGSGLRGGTDGVGAAATFDVPYGIAVDRAGNVFVSDQGTKIRRITAAGVVTTLAGAADMRSWSLAVNAKSDLFVLVVDGSIRKISAAGVVSTIAPTDGRGAAVRFKGLGSVAVDPEGNLLVVDRLDSTIHKITPSGIVSTVAGVSGSAGTVDGPRATARLDSPDQLTVDKMGNIYVTEGAKIRKITADGAVSTVAGVAGRRCVELGPLPASLNRVGGITATPSGDLVITSENAVLDLVFHP